MAENPYILFITGTSVSGKTTLYESLQADSDLAEVEFHDIDEDGVPDVGRGGWREYRVYDLLYQAQKAYRAGKSTVICGVTKPHEVIEAEFYDPRLRVYFLLLEVSDKLLEERLDARLDEHQAAGIDPESTSPEARRRNLVDNFKLKLLLKNSTLNQKNGYILNAEELSREAMHNEAKKIISKIGGSNV